MTEKGEFSIREYQAADYDQICSLMEVFQAHLVALDMMNRQIIDENYGQKCTDATLKELAKDNGKFLIMTEITKPAEVIGFGIGIIPEEKGPLQTLGHKPEKEGIISELFVQEKYRGNGLGKKLVAELEKYFLTQGCAYCRTSVMADNKDAHQAYLRMGFQDRMVEVLKKI